MSAADWNEYGVLAHRLVGKPLQVTGATNSLKLRGDPNDDRKSYLWVDPPWELLENGVVAANSAEYPHHEDSDHRERHTAWTERVMRALQGAVLLDVRPGPDGSTHFRLSESVVLNVGSTETRAVDSQWYDDWYAKE